MENEPRTFSCCMRGRDGKRAAPYAWGCPINYFLNPCSFINDCTVYLRQAAVTISADSATAELRRKSLSLLSRSAWTNAIKSHLQGKRDPSLVWIILCARKDRDSEVIGCWGMCRNKFRPQWLSGHKRILQRVQALEGLRCFDHWDIKLIRWM